MALVIELEVEDLSPASTPSKTLPLCKGGGLPRPTASQLGEIDQRISDSLKIKRLRARLQQLLACWRERLGPESAALWNVRLPGPGYFSRDYNPGAWNPETGALHVQERMPAWFVQSGKIGIKPASSRR